MVKFASFSVLLGVTTATMENLSQMINATIPSDVQVRTFGVSERIILSDYENYGCWCTLNQEPAGKGQPVNEIDILCYECINMDFSNSCTAHSTSYNNPNVDFASNPSNEDIYQACFNANGQTNNCETRVCTVEIAFLRDWWSIQVQVYSFQFDAELSRYQHSQGFTQDSDCQIIRGTASEKQCCGDYPNRFPYRVNGAFGERACCDGKTYNKSTFECCNGDTIALTCA